MDFEKLDRTSVITLDDILGMPFKVLDDGFVRVIDYMGSDNSIVQAARVSYGIGTKKLNEDRGLIRYLMRHSHSTPFEMCELKLHVRVPMDCWRQWIRHRTANVNEYSTRYSLAIDSSQKTEPSHWRSQSTTNKQGSQSYLDKEIGQKLSYQEDELHNKIRQVYDERINAGVAREQARKDLPLSTYTEAYWKIDLHNLLHFLALRMDSHAQYEIRKYATVIGEEIVSKWCPLTWEAFKDYKLSSFNLTATEIRIINSLQGDHNSLPEYLKGIGWIENGKLISSRERVELENKLGRLNLLPLWERTVADVGNFGTH